MYTVPYIHISHKTTHFQLTMSDDVGFTAGQKQTKLQTLQSRRRRPKTKTDISFTCETYEHYFVFDQETNAVRNNTA